MVNITQVVTQSGTKFIISVKLSVCLYMSDVCSSLYVYATVCTLQYFLTECGQKNTFIITADFCHCDIRLMEPEEIIVLAIFNLSIFYNFVSRKTYK
jgi:hypothetical protein